MLPRCYATTPLLIRNRPRQKYKNRLYTKNKKRKESVMSEISRQEFQRRRQALVEQMQPGSAALIFAAPEVTRSADSEYPYRQNSDFWYFTGFNEPEAVLVLIKS
ncbi:MAG: aminopeptidase P N-terminal domain-containing protein, partial [Escherichia coli]|nr:aminopeptidase P N-terminal domain-containing protein [Escherichia coli]